MFPGLVKSWALQWQGSGLYYLRCFGFSPHDHKMAAMVPNIISSYDNIQRQKRNGEGALPTCVYFYQEEKCSPEYPSKHPFLSHESELGHTPHLHPNQSPAKDYSALFSLTIIQPMEPEKEPTYPKDIATHLNSGTESEAVNREKQGIGCCVDNQQCRLHVII